MVRFIIVRLLLMTRLLHILMNGSSFNHGVADRGGVVVNRDDVMLRTFVGLVAIVTDDVLGRNGMSVRLRFGADFVRRSSVKADGVDWGGMLLNRDEVVRSKILRLFLVTTVVTNNALGGYSVSVGLTTRVNFMDGSRVQADGLVDRCGYNIVRVTVRLLMVTAVMTNDALR